MTTKATWQETAMLVTAASSNVNGPWTAIENASALGLVVPALNSASTVILQVARDSSGTGGGPLVDKGGTAILTLASSSGGFSVSSNEMSALLAYPYMRVVLGTNQAADRTFFLEKKVFASDPYA
jgi:hypothetical protein